MTRLAMTILVCCGGFSVADGAQAQQASCLLRITCDPNSLPLSYDTVEALLESSGVLGSAVRESDDLTGFMADSGLRMAEVVSVSFDQVGPRAGQQPTARNMLFGRMIVEVSEEAPTAGEIAEKLLGTICARLEAILVETSRGDRSKMEQRLAFASEEVARADVRLKEIQSLQQTVCAEAGQFDLSRDIILDNITSWERERQSLEMKLAAKQARQRALAEQISLIGHKVDQTAAGDPVVAQLQEVVKLREQELSRASQLYEQEVISPGEMNKVLENLALARAELAKQRQAAAQMAGGNQLGRLNDELTAMAIDVAEAEARLSFIEQQLTQIRETKLLELANRYEREVTLRLPVARQAVQDATSYREKIGREIRSYQPPAVMVFGG